MFNWVIVMMMLTSKKAFTSFKIGSQLNMKDKIPKDQVLAVQSVMLTKQPGILPHGCVNTFIGARL